MEKLQQLRKSIGKLDKLIKSLPTERKTHLGNSKTSGKVSIRKLY